jgi:hypothetical protein
MPRYASRDGYDMWHSWNAQLVHFISYSSEVFFAHTVDIPVRMDET